MRNYLIDSTIKVVTNIEIKAESLQDALDQSKELKMQDFITVKGDWIDGNIVAITGINDITADSKISCE